MAEVLLLLIFCILLFLKIVNDRLKVSEQKVANLIAENSNLKDDVTALQSIIAVTPELENNSKFMDEIVKAAVKLEFSNSDRADQLLHALQKNPKFLQQIQLSTVDEWAELTAEAQFAVSEAEFAVLTNLTEKQRETFFLNVQELASKSPIENEQKEAGNNWPPIISLSEAKNFSFNVGSATLGEQFKKALTGTIADQILEILQTYDADIIEVIGHTDPQPMRNDRVSNLDENAVNFINYDREINLLAKDNAGLGYARALSVTKELMKVPSLRQFTILPYSAAQMITPDEKLQTGANIFDGKQLRRIEIRVRRKQQD